MKDGFTLIEAMIVISILTLMTAFLILYNRTGERQILLLNEKSSIISTILRAKNLSLGVFVKQPIRETVCGYGVYLEGSRYFIYKDLAGNCDLSDKRYSLNNPDELVAGEDHALHPALKFTDKDANDILFAPPIPSVFFDGSPATDEKIIGISDLAKLSEVKIIINNAGQISAQ